MIRRTALLLSFHVHCIILFIAYRFSISTVSHLTVRRWLKLVYVKPTAVTNFSRNFSIATISVLMKADLSWDYSLLNRWQLSVKPSWYYGTASEGTRTRISHGITGLPLESVPCRKKTVVACRRRGIGMVNGAVSRVENFVLPAF